MSSHEIHIIKSAIDMPLMKLPTKSVLIKENERVALISPLPDIKNFKAEIENFGAVTDIISPSGFHHLGVKPAAELFPQAQVWGVPALKNKRADIQWNHILGEGDWPHQTLRPFLLEGMPKLDECLFYHSPSRSLIVSDLVFNHVHGSGLGYFIIFKMFDTYKRFAVSKFFAKFVGDKEKFRQSVRKVLDLDIDRLIVPHGEDVTDSAKEHLRTALSERGLAPL